MKVTKKGIKVDVTNMINGMLEQGGIVGRVVLVPWGSIPGLQPGCNLDEAYNDYGTLREIVVAVAYGRLSGFPVRVIRQGKKIV